jgi:hypothetical protein
LKDIIAVIVTLIAGLIFVLAACQTGKSAVSSSTPATTPAKTLGSVRMTIGTLNSITGNRLVIITNNLGQVFVNINAGTIIIKTASGTITDLKEGQLLTVAGSADVGGNITATSITVRTLGQDPENQIGEPGNYFNSTPSSPDDSFFSRLPWISGNLLSGTVSKINGNTLTLTTVQGQSKVIVRNDTAIQITVNGTASDFQPGQSLILTGNRDANGEITATSITIQSAGISQTPVSSSNSTALDMMPTTLNSGRVGISYSQELVVSGGTPSYQWSIVNGSLPDDFTLDNTTSAIIGWSAASGTFNLTLSLTGAVGEVVTQTMSLLIDPAPTRISE